MTTLADELLAACGGEYDLGGCITSLASEIKNAQRFVIGADVYAAVEQLTKTKPSTLVDAMCISRLPYRTLWVEWRPVEKGPVDPRRPTPQRSGCLIEGDANLQRGEITWVWLHKEHGISVCGISCVFDWSEAGDVKSFARNLCEERFALSTAWEFSDSDLVQELEKSTWKNLANDPKQVAAFRELNRREAPWFSKHCRELINAIFTNRGAEILNDLVMFWLKDLGGETNFIHAFILMLNSRNAIERETPDISRLNKARRRRGRPEFLSHVITRIYMSKSRMRSADAQGISREQARWHSVMGHFKVRKSGVFWWAPFMRGDPTKPLPRSHYATGKEV